MTTSRGDIVRPLGAFERTIDFYMRRNPLQFSLVAEIDRPVSEAQLATALAELRRRHPLLTVTVDRTASEAVYRRTDRAIPVTTLPDGTPWQAVAAAEQTRPIPQAPGPLVRAALLPRGPRCDIVLTFAHQIADGVGGLRALLDLVAALDGEERPPGGVPEAQEDLLARMVTPPDTMTDGPAPDDPRMHATGGLAPFSGHAPHLQALALDRELTGRLVQRCRLESTSVHAALCAAAAVVFHRRGREFVRVLTPVDLRRAGGLPDEVVNRFVGAKTSSEAHEADDFWKLARNVRGTLARLRAPHAIKGAAAQLAEHAPTSGEEAEAMMAAATAADIQITNLGVAEPPPRSAGTLTALWGPAQITQLRGEHVLGVVTVGGRLRMTELTHDPVAGLVGDIAAVLAEACASGPEHNAGRGPHLTERG
ncbi:phthiocerol/phthiodiolone dimycocerosyl transferase family protein [Streptomyces sp. NPDC002853]